MGIFEILKWKSPRNMKTGKAGSWTSLENFREKPVLSGGLWGAVGMFALIFLLGALPARLSSIAESMGVGVETVLGFVIVAYVFFGAYLALVAWELSNKRSMFAVFDFGDPQDWKDLLLFGTVGGAAMLGVAWIISRAVPIIAKAELYPLPIELTFPTLIFIVVVAFFEATFAFGVVWPTLAEKAGIPLGMGLTAILFMIAHYGLFAAEPGIQIIGIQLFSFIFAIVACTLTGARKSVLPAFIMILIVDIIGTLGVLG